MKIINTILAVVCLLSFVFADSLAFAQSNLLPEKTDTVTTESSDSSADNDSAAGSKTKSSENASWIGVVLGVLFAALFLIFLEIAVIPGFGMCGILGSILFIIGIVLAYLKLSSTSAMAVSIVACLGVLLLFGFVVWVLPHTTMGKKFVLQESSPVPEDLLAVSDNRRFLEAEGVAVSNLRPSGIAKIADERVDVITEGDFVEKGTKVKVIKTTAGKVIVAPIDE